MRPLHASFALAGLLAAITPSAACAQTIAITGGTVYPVATPKLTNATVVMRDGHIIAVGTNVAIPPGARVIDARGKVVTPGFINAQTTVGLVEVQEEAATSNASARGAIAAGFRPWDGFFSESPAIASTRAEGVTTVGVFPQGAFVSGQAALVDLDRGTAREMLRRAPIAMVGSFGGAATNGRDRDETAGAPETATGTPDAAPKSRGEGLERLRELLADARYFAAHRLEYDEGRTRDFVASRGDLEALVPVATGALPLVLQLDRVDDIDAAIRFSRAERVRVIIAGGAEAWKIAGRLAAAHIPVLSGALSNIPVSFDALNSRQDNDAILRRAGVEVVLVGNSGGGDDDTGYNARNIRYEAGVAVAYGLPYADALRAVTLAPATVFGAAARVGALTVGRDANVVVWSGDPFEFATVAEHVFVRGREFTQPTREDQLIERYKTLPRSNGAP